MKRIVLFLFLFIAASAEAQLAVKPLLFSPTGELGAVMKKSFTGELIYMDDFSYEPWRIRAGFSFVALKSRLDTLPVYSVEQSGSGTRVLGGWQTFHQYNLYLFTGGYDYAVYDNEPLWLYPGVDFIAGGLDEKYDLEYPSRITESSSGGYILAGIRFRAGGEYKINDRVNVFAEAGRSYYFMLEKGGFSFNQYGAGVHIIFD